MEAVAKSEVNILEPTTFVLHLELFEFLTPHRLKGHLDALT